MNIPRAGVREVRLITPAGGGFTLAFGWLWFPGLRDVLLPGVFGLSGPSGGNGFSPLAFGSALAAGFILFGFLGGRVKPVAALFLSHSGAVVLLCLAFLFRMAGTGMPLAALPEILAGLGAALPGVWWTRRLLAMGPEKAVISLAWAALAALILSFASALFPAPFSPIFAPCAVAAGIILAVPLAFPALPQRRGPDVEDYNAIPLSASFSGAVPGLAPLAALFFGLGSLNVFAPYETDLPSALAQACGTALAALVAAWSQGAFGRDKPERFSSGKSWRIMAFAACILTVSALCLPLFPLAAPVLFFVCSGLAEAAALALAASLCTELREASPAGEKPVPHALYPAAGILLVLILVLANGGWLAGRELLVYAGAFGPALPGFAAAGLLAAMAYREAHKTASILPAIASGLTEKERELALLLLQGHSNKDIAETLELTKNTVRWHIKNLNKKTGAQNRTGLIAILGGRMKAEKPGKERT